MSKVIAFFEPGHVLPGTKEEHEAAANELLRIVNSTSGRRARGAPAKLLTTEDLLRRASDPDSPLHALFEWDDTEAARKFRLDQARRVLRAFRVTKEPDKPPIKLVNTIRIVDDDRKQGYVPVDRAMAYEPDRVIVLRQAASGLVSWRRRYESLQEFESVFLAIDQIDIDDILDQQDAQSA